MELNSAKKIAEELLERLQPHCLNGFIHIAGSIRRQSPEIGDIEIICVPHPYDVGMFADGIAPIINEFKKIKGELPCKYTQRELPQGINLDLFMPSVSDYYRQLAIRTGSSDYSWFIIAKGWVNKGWCGTENGLRKIEECTHDGKKWTCTSSNPSLPLVWKSEYDFFKWLDVNWQEPKDRYCNK